MKVLTQDLEPVAGGSAQYDAGHVIGGALRSAWDAFIAAGNLYVPTL